MTLVHVKAVEKIRTTAPSDYCSFELVNCP